MKIISPRIAFILLVLILIFMVACSSGELNSSDTITILNVEGIYDGTMKSTQLDMILSEDLEGQVTYYQPSQEEWDDWMSMKPESSYSVSLDGESMVIKSIIEEEDNFEGTYDAANNQFIYVEPGSPGLKDTILTLSFYEEQGMVKASGEIVLETIEEGWKQILAVELVKRSE